MIQRRRRKMKRPSITRKKRRNARRNVPSEEKEGPWFDVPWQA